jgi:hypothetical protein
VRENVVVNASAGRSITPRTLARVPGLGELVTLLAVKDVLYDQTTALRRRWLDTRYRIAVRAADRLPNLALRGATIQIDRSPYDVPDRYVQFSDEQGQAAAEVITRLDSAGGRAHWEAEATANRSVATSLSKIPADRAAGLLRSWIRADDGQLPARLSPARRAVCRACTRVGVVTEHSEIAAALLLTGSSASAKDDGIRIRPVQHRVKSVACHVILDHPIVDVPDDAHFRELIS